MNLYISLLILYSIAIVIIGWVLYSLFYEKQNKPIKVYNEILI